MLRLLYIQYMTIYNLCKEFFTNFILLMSYALGGIVDDSTNKKVKNIEWIELSHSSFFLPYFQKIQHKHIEVVYDQLIDMNREKLASTVEMAVKNAIIKPIYRLLGIIMC